MPVSPSCHHPHPSTVVHATRCPTAPLSLCLVDVLRTTPPPWIVAPLHRPLYGSSPHCTPRGSFIAHTAPLQHVTPLHHPQGRSSMAHNVPCSSSSHRNPPGSSSMAHTVPYKLSRYCKTPYTVPYGSLSYRTPFSNSSMVRTAFLAACRPTIPSLDSSSMARTSLQGLRLIILSSSMPKLFYDACRYHPMPSPFPTCYSSVSSYTSTRNFSTLSHSTYSIFIIHDEDCPLSRHCLRCRLRKILIFLKNSIHQHKIILNFKKFYRTNYAC